MACLAIEPCSRELCRDDSRADASGSNHQPLQFLEAAKFLFQDFTHKAHRTRAKTFLTAKHISPKAQARTTAYLLILRFGLVPERAAELRLRGGTSASFFLPR